MIFGTVLVKNRRSNHDTFDYNAKRCYARIIKSMTMMADELLSRLADAFATHEGTLQSVQYNTNTEKEL
jgi:hypothetical protein